MAQQFSATGQQVVTAILKDGTKFFNTLTNGLEQATTQFTTSSHLTTAIQSAALQWLGLQNFKIPEGADLTSVLLSYAGLTVDNVKSMVVQALGANSAVAANLIAQIFDNVPDNAQGLQTVFNNINTLAGSAVLNLGNIETQIENAFESKLETAATQAMANLIAKFVPGAGAVSSLINGFTFLLDNQSQIAGIVNDFLGRLGQLASGNASGFASQLVKALDNSLPFLLKFAASQLGLGNLPQQVQNAVQAVPNYVQQQLMAILTAIAKRIPLSGLGASNNLYAGQLAPIVKITYQGVVYDLWVAKDGSSAVVKIALDSTQKLVSSLTAANFTGGAIVLFNTLQSDAQKLASLLALVPPLSTTKNQPLPNQRNLADQQNLVNKVQADENGLKEAAQAGQCTALDGSGCFRVGNMLITKRGLVAIEEIVVGDYVLSVSEFDPRGALEWKRVEAVFRRTGCIFDITVEGGLVIGTTPEHKFHVRATDEWVEAGAIKPGDELRTDKGWVTVEKVFDTGCYETVYNVRVADFHTYFVGNEICAVWAHNACIVEQEITANSSVGMKYARAALKYRQQQIARYGNSPQMQEAWAQGGKNIAYATTQNAGLSRVGVSGQSYNPQTNQVDQVDAEKQLIAALTTAGIPANDRVSSLFTERSPCAACLDAIKAWLSSQPGRVIVYYVIPYSSGQTTQLIAGYDSLGLSLS